MKNKKVIAKAVVSKIKKQVPDSAEAKLMFAVFATAVSDLFQKNQKNSAATYLKSDMPHLNRIGIEPSWVRLQFKIAGIDDLYT